jgi:endogenous inhibitor of DNA gyrase (YacG/DUF329 family)
MPLMQCPSCNSSFNPEKSAAMPFCSDRCKEIDLGRWLGEQHSLPADPEAEEESFETY